MDGTNFNVPSNDIITTVSTDTSRMDESSENDIDLMMLFSCVIASLGIVSNLTVVIVFLNHKKFRGKIPNIFIINQVSYFEMIAFSHK